MSGEIKLASNYGYREYPHRLRYDPINDQRGYYYKHPDYNIFVIKDDTGWITIQRQIYRTNDFKDALKHFLPKKLK